MKKQNAEKKYNPSLGSAFEDPRFGEGSITLSITEENLDTIMKNFQVGTKVVFKFNKVTKYGNKQYFVDVLPPFIKTQGTSTTTNYLD